MLLALGVAFALGWIAFGAPRVSASVTYVDAEPRLELAFAGVADGTQVACLGVTTEVRNARIVVPAPPGTFPLGTSAVEVHVGRHRLTASVLVDRWISHDDDALAADPPRVGLVIAATAGTVVTVDGESINLDSNGRGRWSAVVTDASTEFHRDVVVRWVRGAELSVERLRVSAAPTESSVVQPPADFITDRPNLTVDVAAVQTATVLIDGQSVDVVAGHARWTLTLPGMGERRVRIDILEPGRMRRITSLRVVRVRDLDAAASDFTGDPAMTYAAFDDAVTSRGRQVDVTGHAYHVRVESGRSFIQMMVDACPIPAGCPLWVEYPSVTTARIGDAIRVRGTYAGIQTYRDESLRADLRAPRVDAAFVTAVRP